MLELGRTLLEGQGVEAAVNRALDVVAILQLLSTLEIVHGAIGLVSFGSAKLVLFMLLASAMTTAEKCRGAARTLLKYYLWYIDMSSCFAPLQPRSIGTPWSPQELLIEFFRGNSAMEVSSS